MTVSAVCGRLALCGLGGEPVDWRRTLVSHGVATLPPNRIDTEGRTMETSLALPGGSVRRVLVVETGPQAVEVRATGGPVTAAQAGWILRTVRNMLSLDEDLSRFYALASADHRLRWATTGAGRMLRSPSVFEDMVKTICTTNCGWPATERMVGALVAHLGPAGAGGCAFPTPAAMAGAGEEFYREVARTGYRGTYLRRLAEEVADGRIDLEALRDPERPDAEVESYLLALPGVGPYAASHLMLTSLGRYRRLILDSWTRPTYARVVGRRVSDQAIERAFRRYRDYAGLAFWLLLTRDWVPD